MISRSMLIAPSQGDFKKKSYLHWVPKLADSELMHLQVWMQGLCLTHVSLCQTLLRCIYAVCLSLVLTDCIRAVCMSHVLTDLHGGYVAIATDGGVR